MSLVNLPGGNNSFPSYNKPYMGQHKPIGTKPTVIRKRSVVAKSDPVLANMLLGGDSGCTIEGFDPDKKFSIGIFNNGAWLRTTNEIGVFTNIKHEFVVAALGSSPEKSFEMTMQKLPASILHAIHAFFYEVMQTMSNSEVMVQIFLKKSTGEYVIHVPTQTVTSVSIKFEHDSELLSDPDYVWVLDIHSHNSMNAYFSGGDDADEKSTRIFGVIGRITDTGFEAAFRAGCGGEYLELKMSDVFLPKPETGDNDINPYDIDPQNLLKVTTLTFNPHVPKNTSPHYSRSAAYDWRDEYSHHGYYPGSLDPNDPVIISDDSLKTLEEEWLILLESHKSTYPSRSGPAFEIMIDSICDLQDDSHGIAGHNSICEIFSIFKTYLESTKLISLDSLNSIQATINDAELL